MPELVTRTTTIYQHLKSTSMIAQLFMSVSMTFSRIKMILAVMNSGCLGDQYTSLGAQIMAPKKHISSFIFLVVFQQMDGWMISQYI